SFVQSASGFTLTIPPWSWSSSTFLIAAREAHCSRRRPVNQASSPCRARTSGRTLRTWQQRSRNGTEARNRSGPCRRTIVPTSTGSGRRTSSSTRGYRARTTSMKATVAGGRRPVSTVIARTSGRIRAAMSSTAIPSACIPVTTATRSPKVSSPQPITSLGSSPSSRTAISPISSSSKTTRPLASALTRISTTSATPLRRSAGHGHHDREAVAGAQGCLQPAQFPHVLLPQEHEEGLAKRAARQHRLPEGRVSGRDRRERLPHGRRPDLEPIGTRHEPKEWPGHLYHDALGALLCRACSGPRYLLPAGDRGELLVGSRVAELREPDRPLRPLRDPGTEESLENLLELAGGDPTEELAPDRRAAPEPTADREVVGLYPRRAVGRGRRRPLQPDLPDPVLRARVRAPVHVDRQVPERLGAEACREVLEHLLQLLLGLRDRVVAEAVGRARDRTAVDRGAIEGHADLGEPPAKHLEPLRRNEPYDEVLLPREPRVRPELLEEVGELLELATRDPADGNRDAHGDETFLSLRLDAQVIAAPGGLGGGTVLERPTQPLLHA